MTDKYVKLLSAQAMLWAKEGSGLLPGADRFPMLMDCDDEQNSKTRLLQRQRAKQELAGD